MMRRLTSMGFLLCAAAFGQAFEAASVKTVLDWPPAERGSGERGASGGGCRTSMKIDPARVDFHCVNLAMLIGYAFRISPDRITGPDWMTAVGATRFNIVANIPAGAAREQVPERFQTLLSERFQLATHRAARILPAYCLAVAKGGLKVKRADGPPPSENGDAAAGPDGFYGDIQQRTIPNADGKGSTTMMSSPLMGTVWESGEPYQVQRWEAPAIKLAGLADLINQVIPLSSPVVDMTGVKGRYRLLLEVSLPRPESKGADELEQAALQEFNDGLLKLGLRLELRKRPIETLVVDHVEKTPTEN